MESLIILDVLSSYTTYWIMTKNVYLDPSIGWCVGLEIFPTDYVITDIFVEKI